MSAGGAAYIILQQMEDERRRAVQASQERLRMIECQGMKGRGKIHRWKRRPDGTARCLNCDLVLTKEQTDDMFYARQG